MVNLGLNKSLDHNINLLKVKISHNKTIKVNNNINHGKFIHRAKLNRKLTINFL